MGQAAWSLEKKKLLQGQRQSSLPGPFAARWAACGLAAPKGDAMPAAQYRLAVASSAA